MIFSAAYTMSFVIKPSYDYTQSGVLQFIWSYKGEVKIRPVAYVYPLITAGFIWYLRIQ